MMHETITAARAGVYFSAEARPLADALDYLARFIAEKRGGIAGLAAVTIEADTSGLIVLSSCDTEMHAVVTLQGDVDRAGIVDVNAATLRNLVRSAARGARVMIRETEPGRLAVSHGRIVQSIPTQDSRDVPALRPAVNDAIEVDTATFAIDLARVAPFITTHEQRGGALLLQRTPEAFELIAGDGYNLAVAMRDAPDGIAWRMSVGEKAAKALARAVKTWPKGTLSLACESDDACLTRLTLIGDHFALTLRGDDGDDWGDWRAQADKVLGSELQRVFSPDDAPRLNRDAMANFAKGVKAFDVEIGESAARLSIPGDASWLGISMLASWNQLPRGYSYGSRGEAQAREYLTDYMSRHGIEPAPGEQRLEICNGRVIGMTCGTYHERRVAHWETVLDWEALVERHVEIVEQEAGWQEGAFSVVMPRVSESVVSEVSVEFGDDCLPLARDEAGTVYMTAEQVAKWCGPVDSSTHVDIPRAPVRRAWWKKAAPVGAPHSLTPRNALCLSLDEMRDYAEACQRAADLANNLAAMAEAAPAIDPEPAEPAAPDMPEPDFSPVECVAAPGGAEVPEAVESPALPDAAPVAAPVGDELAELRAMVLAMAARIDALDGGARVDPVAAPEPVAPPVAPLRDRATRLKLVRTYLALRRARAELCDMTAMALRHSDARNSADSEAIEYRRKIRNLEQELAARDQQVEAAGRLFEAAREAMETERAARDAEIAGLRASARRAIDTEEALMNARARGNRLLRVAIGQRTALSRARIDLRGVRAESGALRRQLAQALHPAPAAPAPAGAMADAFARL